LLKKFIQGMKLFVVSADPRLSLGYSKIINKIANHLTSKDDLEIVMFTVNYRESMCIKNIYIDPRIKLIPHSSPEDFGYKQAGEHIKREKPDFVMIYASANIIENYMKYIDESQKVIVYLDICQKWADTLIFQNIKSRVHHWFTFLNCWRDHMINDQKIDADRVSVIEHGINFEEFDDNPSRYPGFENFTVVNMNRNSLRKEWHVTLSAFIEFISRHDFDPSLKLFISCGVNGPDEHVNIENHVYTEFMKRGLDYMNYTKNFIINNNPLRLSKEELNSIYFSADVGINTCVSEGFGLTSIEHAYFNKPQILTDIPTFRDTLGDNAIYVKPRVTTMYTGDNELNGERAILDHMDVADAIDKCYKERLVFNTRDYVLKRFSWKNVYKQIDRMVDILKDGSI
jgi:glycosyltransferase involved in cell wall biosynthesis